MSPDASLPVPNVAVVFRALPDGAVLLSTETEVYFGLNVVGARVWQLLPPATTHLGQLCERLAAEYPDAPAAQIRADVVELLDTLLDNRLVVASPAVEHRAPTQALSAAAAG